MENTKGEDLAHVDHNGNNIIAQPRHKKTFLGQTYANWYTYWICGVASIAIM